MKKRIAIIGANASITMLIEKAKALGFETHVFAWACGDPGEKTADYFYPISIDEKEEITTRCRELGVVGVCSITSDFAVPTVNYVAHELGLVGNPLITSELARNKYKMRCAFKQAGLYTPFFIRVNTNYTDEEVENISYPVIVKPTDRWSSKGVTRVNRKEDLQKAVCYAAKESFDNFAIIEEYMSGQEYSAECICFKGKVYVLAYTQKQTTGYPHYIESGHFQPALLSKEDKERITKVASKALKALCIENGAAHMEFKILPNGEIGIIEIGARMGGDCIGTDLTPISTGMDYIRMVIDIACGKEPSFSLVGEPLNVKIKFIMTKNDLITFRDFQNNLPERIIRFAEIDDNFERNVVDSSTRHGYYIIRE